MWCRAAGFCFIVILSQGISTSLPARAADSSETSNSEGSFIVLGDWGNPFHPGENDGNVDCWGPHWRCNGCGQSVNFTEDNQNWCNLSMPGYAEDEFAQTNVSQQMKQWAKEHKAQLVVNVGDSFYPGGVESATHAMWSYVFEDRYADDAFQVPWFSVLGNHDYGGFQCFFESSKMVFTHAQAQIDYDTEPDWEWPKSKKTRWVMPNYFYKKRVKFGRMTIDMFMIDTNYADGHDGPLACGQGEIKIPPACEGDDLTNCKAACAKIGADQFAWLKDELPKSKANWKFLVGHHPLSYFVGISGGIPGLTIDFFIQNDIAAYFCGHVHGMAQSWYLPKPDGSFERTEGTKVISGALFEMQNGAGGGSYPDSSFNGARWGYTGVKVTESSMEITYFGDEQQPSKVILKPPKPAPDEFPWVAVVVCSVVVIIVAMGVGFACRVRRRRQLQQRDMAISMVDSYSHS